MARTRYVYPSDMVAHLWANKRKDGAGIRRPVLLRRGHDLQLRHPFSDCAARGKQARPRGVCSPPAITA